MDPKDHKLGRLRQLQAFVSDPVRIQNLRGRSGDTLKAKMRVKVLGERTRFDADEQRVLDELNNLVTCRDDVLVGTSHGGASTTANTLDVTTTAVPTAYNQKHILMGVSSGASHRGRSFADLLTYFRKGAR